MGWRGSGGNGAATMYDTSHPLHTSYPQTRIYTYHPPHRGVFFFFGGVLMLVGGFLEFIIGNTFPFVVFMSFGAFWLTFAATLQPFYNAAAAYAPPGSASPVTAGLATEGYNSSFAFFMIFMGVLCFIYLICSLRTNVCFVVIFLSLVLAFGLLGGTFFHTAEGNLALAHRLQVVGLRLFVLTWVMLADECLGCWGVCIRDFAGWLVDILRHHARCPRFSHSDSSRRSLHHDQGCE